MDKHIINLIDAAINKLNWSIIISSYTDYETIPNKKIRPVTINTIKKDLKNVCKFIIENNITYFDQDQFIITWDYKSQINGKLDILYVPTRSTTFDDKYRFEPLDDESEISETELAAFQKLLVNAVNVEDYELAAVLRDRINRANKATVKINKH